MKKCFVLILGCMLNVIALGQVDSTAKVRLHVGGFVEAYYGMDAAFPSNHLRPCFLYNHHRAGEVAVNMALLQFSAEHDRYRAHVGLMAGTYPQANLASEPVAMRFIYEANAGVAIGKSGRTWLDMGIFPSYIGFEGAISTDNLTLSRSLCAEGSPYFLTGARIGTHTGKRWEFAGYLLNGWQRIRTPNGRTMPSFGTQARFQATDKLLFNWSTFLGTDDPDVSRRMRYFSNLYLQAQPSAKLAVTAGFDIGMQQAARGSNVMQAWLSPVVIAKYALTNRLAVVGRAEYYMDPHGVIVSCNQGVHGFQTGGASLGADYHPQDNVWLRLEARGLQSRDRIFDTRSGLSNRNGSLLGSIAVRIP